ncbi:hypothetical protein BD626DRAFT_483507 [Schizophyllum amplum]|uniref:Uncharacterized protein n=1 Tax=Schizophyllum amplum TaxID=97359 RepID=A0A550CPI4_9AGAR|nr:hypothetical protein BD626DRAFT_483507 [Auriculariopsis ampla]
MSHRPRSTSTGSTPSPVEAHGGSEAHDETSRVQGKAEGARGSHGVQSQQPHVRQAPSSSTSSLVPRRASVRDDEGDATPRARPIPEIGSPTSAHPDSDRYPLPMSGRVSFVGTNRNTTADINRPLPLRPGEAGHGEQLYNVPIMRVSVRALLYSCRRVELAMGGERSS